MKSLKGTQTEKNLMTAFLGESQARNLYTYFAAIANKEGYRQIKEAFEETANHEKEHAKRLFKFLEGGDININTSFSATPLGTTVQNLQEAIKGESHECQDMYPSFAKIAQEENFSHIAQVFWAICKAEEYHKKRFEAFLNNIETDRVFKRGEEKVWRCMNCGYIHEGESAPTVCPACDHPTKHFEILCTNWL